ncbi:hypothetical protein LCGC14_2461970, partial [marine sediment metagenome]
DGTSRCSGLETYDIETGKFAGRVVAGHSHGDLGVTAAGREFFMTDLTDASHPAGTGQTGLAWYPLPGTATAAKPHFVQLLDWKAAMGHISCQGPAGVCLVSSVSDSTATCCRRGWQPFQGEVWLQYVEGGGKPNFGPVKRLAHHRSSEQGYWAQPKGTLSRDGRYALFGSDWGIDKGRERVDPYLIRLTTQTAKSRIRMTVRPRKVRADRRRRFRFRVTTVRGGKRRVVRAVTIRLAGRRARTNRRGRATIVKRFRRPGRYRARASKRGLRRGTASVRVVRRRRR